MKYLLILAFMLLCGFKNPPMKDFEDPDYQIMGSRISGIVGEKIESETGMRLTDIIVNQKMALVFQCFNEMTVEQGRKLLIRSVNRYLKAINSIEVIRPYLSHYPFTPSDIGIIIVISTPIGKEIQAGSLFSVSAVSGQLNYRFRQAGSIPTQLVQKETYEEAVHILVQEQPAKK